jgi:GT2 family glycosyltransferase/O-antigen/teichoic acid export membrane protein
MNPVKRLFNLISRDALLKHSGILIVASLISNVLSFAFGIFMIRMLEGQQGDFADLAVMLSLIGIVSRPVMAIQPLIARNTSLLFRDGNILAAWRFVLRACRHFILAGVIVLLAGLLFANPLAHFFRVSSPSLIVLSMVTIAGSFLIPVLLGALQGIQSFIWMSSIGVVSNLSRLLMGVFLVMLGFSVAGALTAQAVSVLVALVIAAIGLSPIVKSRAGTQDQLGLDYTYFMKSMCILACMTLLLMGDSVIFKRQFTSEEADLFSKIGLLARSVVYLSVPVGVALFPKVVSRGSGNAANADLLKKGIGLVMVIVLGAALFCTLFSSVIVQILMPTAPDYTARYLTVFIWAMAPLGLVDLLISYEMAHNRFRCMNPLVCAAALYYLGAYLFHDNFYQIAIVLASASTLAAFGCVMVLPWRSIRTFRDELIEPIHTAGELGKQITVLIPVYNGEDYIEECIMSILRQDHQDLQVIVRDNQSTDGTVECVKRLMDDPRVSLIQNDKNLGSFGNFNACLDSVETDSYMVLCSDDLFYKTDALSRAWKVLSENPDVSVVYSDLAYIDGDSEYVTKRCFYREGRFSNDQVARQTIIGGRNLFSFPVLIRSSARNGYYYDPALSYMGDVDFSIKLAHSGNSWHLPDMLIGNRYHGSNISVEKMYLTSEQLFFIADRFSIHLSAFDKIQAKLLHTLVILQKRVFFWYLAQRSKRGVTARDARNK